MRNRNGRGARQQRQEIAQLAARLLVEDGRLSFSAARRKAQERLGYGRGRELPDNREIETALIAYQRLFGGAGHAERVARLRRQAVSAMRFLRAFDPCLVGPVLSGTACDNAIITLHVFAGTVEEVTHFLQENGIPFRLGERRYRNGEDACPVIGFVAGDHELEIVVFPVARRHQAPPSEIDGRPMTRADVEGLLALMESETQPPQGLSELVPPFP